MRERTAEAAQASAAERGQHVPVGDSWPPEVEQLADQLRAMEHERDRAAPERRRRSSRPSWRHDP